MGFLLSLLGNKYVIIGILAAVVVGGGTFYVSHLKSEVATLTADNKVLTTDLQVSQASVKTLQASLDEQNAAVDKLKAAADARAQTHVAELAVAKKASDGYKAQAAALLATKLPQNTNTCSAANDLINQEIQNAK